MRVFTRIACILACCLMAWALPSGYDGKPFKDQHHKTGAQVIPGTVELALYNLGGNGVAYHDTDKENQGSIHNRATVSWPEGQQKWRADQNVPAGDTRVRLLLPRKGRVDVSYLRDITNFTHKTNMFQLKKDQHYIGREEEGEWANDTVDVNAAGVYTIKVLFAHKLLEVNLSLDNKPAGVCKLPVHNESMHRWNKASCGEITFPTTGLQVLTVHFRKGINLASFEFVKT